MSLFDIYRYGFPHIYLMLLFQPILQGVHKNIKFYVQWADHNLIVLI